MLLDGCEHLVTGKFLFSGDIRQGAGDLGDSFVGAGGKIHLIHGVFKMHYTPKQGSWLNMAEIEIGLLSRTWLAPRIGTPE
jgi:hypothetical protein